MYVYHCKYKIYDFNMRIFRSLLSISLMLQVTRWAPPVPLVHHDGLKLRSHAARHPTRLTDLPKRGRDPKFWRTEPSYELLPGDYCNVRFPFGYLEVQDTW